MCGFVALIASQCSEPLLKGLRDTLMHRGPDGEGAWLGQSQGGYTVGLAHRRLKIIDLSQRGAQPMWTSDGRQGIVFNGEIYNFQDLKKDLQSKGIVFQSFTDTEVLLYAYKVYGLDFIEKLNGMFAFALWDQDTQRLVVARDRFGEKPLYYTHLPTGGIMFASEIKALLAHPDVPIEANERLMALFANGSLDFTTDETYFKGVYRFPSSHLMVFDGKGEKIAHKRYWTPHITPSDSPLTHNDSDHFLHLLQDSVKGRFQADVAVGTCLSGGLDSSFITGLAYKHHNPKAALSARFPSDPTMDEGAYIDAMLASCKGNGITVTPTPQGLMEECETLHYHQEEPFLSASMYLEWCVLRTAKAHGITVMLDGQGADEVLGGYQYYFQRFQYDLVQQKKYGSFIKETLLFNHRMEKESKKYTQAHRRFNKNVAYPLSSFPSLLKPLTFSNDLISSKDSGWFRYQQIHGLLYDMLPFQLRSADLNGMAHSIETRFPFLDYTFVDWCLKLPASSLIHKGWQKYILRQAAQDVIPSCIQWRADKVGFAAPLDEWMRHEMKDWTYDHLQKTYAMGIDGLDKSYTQTLFDDHQKGMDHSWKLWQTISLGQWLGITWKKIDH